MTDYVSIDWAALAALPRPEKMAALAGLSPAVLAAASLERGRDVIAEVERQAAAHGRRGAQRRAADALTAEGTTMTEARVSHILSKHLDAVTHTLPPVLPTGHLIQDYGWGTGFGHTTPDTLDQAGWWMTVEERTGKMPALVGIGYGPGNPVVVYECAHDRGFRSDDDQVEAGKARAREVVQALLDAEPALRAAGAAVEAYHAPARAARARLAPVLGDDDRTAEAVDAMRDGRLFSRGWTLYL